MHTAEKLPVTTGDRRREGLSPASAITTVIDLEGNIQYANETARDLCESVRGYRDVKHISEFGVEGRALLAHLGDVLETGEHRSSICRIAFSDVRGDECMPAELYYLQMFPVSGRQAVGHVIQPLRGVRDIAVDLLDDCESEKREMLIRVGGRSTSYSGQRSER